MEAGSEAQGTSEKVRWRNYRSIIQHVLHKLPCKGKKISRAAQFLI